MERKYLFKKLKRMLTYIQKFYDDMFQYHYYRLKNKDTYPQVVPIALLSFLQAVNIFSFVIIIVHYFFEENWTDLPLFLLIIYCGFLFFNFFKYEIKDRRGKILEKNKTLSNHFGKISALYFIISISIPLLIIYFINEFL